MKAIITKITHGKFKGQFRFKIVGGNGEIVATSEQYTQKHNIISLFKEHFGNIEIVDRV